MATVTAMMLNDSANMLNDNMLGSDNIEMINNNSSESLLENKISGLINDISDNHSFLQKVMQKGTISSPNEMLKVQHRIEQFVLSTQLASKVASTIIKNVDTLTKIQ